MFLPTRAILAAALGAALLPSSTPAQQSSSRDRERTFPKVR
ncbi:MAG: hypothetical protein ABR499_13065 [Gemmatimonadaceae bacterium]